MCLTKINISWTIEDNKMVKYYVFSNFIEAINFVNQVAKLSEKINHHPDLHIYDYKKVKLSLFTHSQNKVTDLDYSLAKQIDEL